MKKLLTKAFEEAKTLPKGALIAAAIIPGGVIAATAYLIGRKVYKDIKEKDNNNDRSENHSG